jgi:NAD+ kinase
MTELSADESETKLIDLLSGKGWLDERSVLEVELPADQDEIPRILYALNDTVVSRGAISRIIHIEASINDELLTTYRADGVIVASATGSTGYSLAAGGPILYPQADELILLPILPHLGSKNTLVLPNNAVIKLQISTNHEAILSVDGHINLPISNGGTIIVRHSSQRVRFLRIDAEASFYGSLEQRLKGKQ